jgi:RsmE family RNA methyltransferase
MNSICFYSHEISDTEFLHIEDSKRLGHLKTHLRSKKGDSLKVTILDKGIYMALITDINEKSATLKLSFELESNASWFHLLVGLSRPQTIKKILEHTSTFGVSSVTISKAKLSEKSYSTSKIYENNNYIEYFIDGISQSKNYFKLPSLELQSYINLEKFKGLENKYFLSLNTKETFLSHSNKLDNPVIAIGPERGWTSQEESLLISNGFTPIGISNSTLRVEHATFSAISQIEMLKLNKKE